MLYMLIIMLAASVVLLPITRWLGLGSIVGYLLAGALIGPSCLGLVTPSPSLENISSFGIVMLLFLIGLELRPHRLWVLRTTILSLGFSYMLPSTLLITAGSHALGLEWPSAIVLGMTLPLSSTALVLPLLHERHILADAAGRDTFAVLLFQEVTAVFLAAMMPLMAHKVSGWLHMLPVLRGMGVIIGLSLFGLMIVPQLLKLSSKFHSKELFTVLSLLLVLGSAAATDWAGLSLSFGAFMAGAMLSDSEYRHEIKEKIEPFQGLLLGLFFISIGASLHLVLLRSEPRSILGLLALLFVVKLANGFLVGLAKRHKLASAIRFTLSLPQASEFSFVLFGVAANFKVIDAPLENEAVLVVALSLLLMPLLFTANEGWLMPRMRN